MSAEGVKNLVLGGVAAVGGAVAQALGGWDQALGLLVALMALDYITGVLLAGVWKRSPKTESGKLSSVAGFKGLLKKGMVLLLVWVAVLLDRGLGTSCARTAVILFFAGNEGLSFLENLGLMGVPFPAFMEKMFEALREKGDKGDGTA